MKTTQIMTDTVDLQETRISNARHSKQMSDPQNWLCSKYQTFCPKTELDTAEGHTETSSGYILLWFQGRVPHNTRSFRL